ncbi:MAG TPA: DMT family transporter [Desulfuromonadaceae bacterium]|nr:DMT family transporter [Desulfuromonadaceae bacterium]
MLKKSNTAAIILSLLLTIFLWGGNNVGTKYLVASWPTVWMGSIRLLLAGPILLAVLRYTNWLGEWRTPTAAQQKQLWLRGGLSLALYIIAFNWGLRLTAASHVALCLGASPVWALLWEERPRRTWASARRYGAAALAMTGIIVLFWPALHNPKASLVGDCFGLMASVLWAVFSRQIRFLSSDMSGTEVAAHTMWMAGAWLLPIGLVEIRMRGFVFDGQQLGVLGLCVVLGAVVPYALWNSALQHWQTSRVMLFNNLIPLSTMLWAHHFLNEPITSTFWMAMTLIVAGVVLGQGDWVKFFKLPESF